MKLNKLFLGMIGMLAITTACSSDENIPDYPSTPGDNSEARFMSVTIRNTGVAGTRAAGDQNGDFEEGLGGENAINSIRFYFFGENGQPFTLANASGNYYDCVTKDITVDDEIESGMPNVEKVYKAVLILRNQDMDFTKLKSMVAVVNTNIGEGSKTLSELQQITGDYGQTGKYNNKSTNLPAMIMTSSVFGTDNSYEGCEVFISPAKLKTNENDALGDPVDVYVERVLAKVRVTAKWDNSITTKDVGNGTVLVALKDKDGNAVTVNGKQVYARFEGWGMQTFTDKSYLFKNIGGSGSLSTWNSNLGSWWNAPNNYRSFWAMNPSDVEYKHATHKSADAKIATVLSSSNGNVTTTINYDGDFLYTQENAADNVNGLKTLSDYNPDNATSTRTQAYFRAVLVDENNLPISLAKWGNQDYTEEGVTTAMLNTLNTQLFLRKAKTTSSSTEGSDGTTNETVTTYEYISLPADLVELVPAEDAGKADSGSENSKRYLSYLKLKDNYAAIISEKYPEYDGKFYNGRKEAIADTEVNTMLSSMPGAKVWRNGETYYYTDLAHLNPGANNVTKGAYGVVRNHIYEVELLTVTGLGTPVLIPVNDKGEEVEKEIIPQKPQDDTFFLGARLNVLSWRIVPNNTHLDW